VSCLTDKAASAGCRIEQLNPGPASCDLECKYCPVYEQYTQEIYLTCKLRSVRSALVQLLHSLKSKLFSLYLNQ